MHYYFFFFYIFQKGTFSLEKKHLLKEILGSPHTSNRIYLLQNCFSNYVFLKDMYMTLKTSAFIGVKNFDNL